MGADGDGEGDAARVQGLASPAKLQVAAGSGAGTSGHRADRGRAVLEASWGPWAWHQPLPAPPAPCQNLPNCGAHPCQGSCCQGVFASPDVPCTSLHCQGLART